jgi:hypothetical protein
MVLSRGDQTFRRRHPDSWVRGTVDGHKWIGVVFSYSDLFHLVSRGQTRRNLWGPAGGQAELDWAVNAP